MKKALIAATVLSLACGLPTFAADIAQPPQAPAPNFDQRKADILKMIEGRINSLQDEKNCVQAAKNHEDLQVCREKHRAEAGRMRDDMGKRGGPGGPW
jgi:hypothetical protein